jgi:diguanylate cyclase (GGDEF)-like protein
MNSYLAHERGVQKLREAKKKLGKAWVDRFYDTLRQLRLWSQPAIYVGAAMVGAVWLSFSFHLAVEHDRSLAAATQNTSNLARVFEEHIVRTVMEVDRTLRLLRSSYQVNGNFNLANSLVDFSRQSDFLLEIRLIDSQGDVIGSTTRQVSGRANARDRDYFETQRDVKTDDLFISQPLVGRTAGIWLLELSRPIRSADGAFQGVVVASLDPRYLAKFYHSIDVGYDGSIFLAGLDGVVRATAGFHSSVLGGSMLSSQLFKKIAHADTGTFLTAGNQDGIKRFVSYRVVKGLPLVVYVGQAEHEVLANYWNDRSSYFAVAVGATILIVIAVIFAVRYRRRLNAAQNALQASEARARNQSLELEVTLEHIDQGIMMVDADRNIMVMNRRVIDLLGLPEDYCARPLKLDDIRSYLRAKGEFTLEGSAPEPRTSDLIATATRSTDVAAYERPRPNGVTLEIHATALPDGGVVRTISDVSERKRKELQIAHMARHDALTNLANRTLLNERVDQALARMRRQQEGFALFYLDLDRFKAVNDIHGHPAGDALLQRVADRLSVCVRETDTLARLGGDEFAILQHAIDCEEDVEALAQRILGAVGTPYYFDGYRTEIGISIGIAVAPRDGTNPEDLFKAADAALYRAKSNGGNAYDFFGRPAQAGMTLKKLAPEKLQQAV